MIAEQSNNVNPRDMSPGLRRTIGPRWLRIRMYHAIARVADDPNRICVSPRRFEAQRRY
jgi:hypothetical protein